MALFLVLAFGTDYAVFQAEAVKTVLPGIALLFSCLTTLSSFGLLAFTSFNVTKVFGETLFIGIVLAFLFSPLATYSVSKSNSK
jgi:predicted exporter